MNWINDGIPNDYRGDYSFPLDDAYIADDYFNDDEYQVPEQPLIYCVDCGNRVNSTPCPICAEWAGIHINPAIQEHWDGRQPV